MNNMNKILAVVLCAALLGCAEESPIDKNGRPVAEKSEAERNVFVIRMPNGRGELSFNYVVVDGHEYLLMTGPHISGLTHSPKCGGCQKTSCANGEDSQIKEGGAK